MNDDETIHIRTEYFWYYDRIVELTSDKDLPKHLAGCPCIDPEVTRYTHRTGWYDENEQWTYMPFNQFPEEFKFALFIMGITA